MHQDFYTAIEKRRSIYAIGKEEVLPHAKIVELLVHAIKFCPSAFNSQSARIVVLFKDHHTKLWSIVKESLRSKVTSDNFSKTETKIESFNSGYGTILFFEDQETIRNLQEKFPTYKDSFPSWSLQSSGMLQYIIWTSLETKGLGASLQHYNPLIDEDVYNEWNISREFKLISQMPFGKKLAPAEEKTFLSIDKRLKVFE